VWPYLNKSPVLAKRFPLGGGAEDGVVQIALQLGNSFLELGQISAAQVATITMTMVIMITIG
jgi:hypothetical protein